MKKVKFTDEEEKYIEHHYSRGEKSVSQIARDLGYDRGVVRRKAKEMGLEKVFPKGTQGKKYIWTKEKDALLIRLYDSSDVTVVDIAEEFGTSEDTVTKRAKSFGLNKRIRNSYSKENIDEIKDKARSMSIVKIANSIGFSEESVRKKVKELGLKNLYYDEKKEEWALKRQEEKARIDYFKNEKRRARVAPVDDDAFLWDLSNPYYTTYQLGQKYNLNPSTIGNWRSRLLGKMHASPVMKGIMTELEDIVSKILTQELDATYFFEHDIGSWNIDFYLGNKKGIEVQGERWHKSESVKEKDQRKLKELSGLGYSILYLHEQDILKKPVETKRKIVGFLQQ